MAKHHGKKSQIRINVVFMYLYWKIMEAKRKRRKVLSENQSYLKSPRGADGACWGSGFARSYFCIASSYIVFNTYAIGNATP
jgi:hypothetical protein